MNVAKNFLKIVVILEYLVVFVKQKKATKNVVKKV